MPRRPACDPATAQRLLGQGVSKRQIAKRLGVSRNAVETALRAGPLPPPGVPYSASSLATSESPTDERGALRQAAARWEAMSQDPATHPRDRIAAGAEQRRCLKRIAELDAAAVRVDSREAESVDARWVREKLQRLDEAKRRAIAAALEGAPADLAGRVWEAAYGRVPGELELVEADDDAPEEDHAATG